MSAERVVIVTDAENTATVESDGGRVELDVLNGSAGGFLRLTAAQARELAAALLAHADEVDA